MNLQRVAAAVPFAQLLGLAKRAEDDDEARRARRADNDGDEDDDKKGRRAEDDQGDPDAKNKRADSDDSDDDSAEDGDESEDGDRDEDEEGDGDDGDEEGKKSRKAKSKSKGASEDDDEGDENGRKAKSARGAARRERARCAAIIAHGVAIGSVRQACVLAFDTGMGVKAAKASLNACKADGSIPRSGLADRMAAAGIQTVAAGSAESAAPGLTKTAAAIIAIGEKTRK